MVFDDVKDYERNNILIGGMIYYFQYNDKDEQKCEYEIVFRDTDVTARIWAKSLSYML